MLRLLAVSSLCGVATASVVAVATAYVGDSASLSACVLEWLLLLPFSLAAALGWLVIRAVLPHPARPAHLLAAAREENSPRATAAVLATGMSSLALLPVTYRIIHLGMTRFHNLELASLLVMCALSGIVAIFIAAGLGLYKTLFRLLAKGQRRFSRWMVPWFAVLLVAGAWTGALLPPLFRAPRTDGLFGFVGLLRLDGLSIAPLVAGLCLAVLVGLGLLATMDRAERRALFTAGLLCTAATACAPLLAVRLAKHDFIRAQVERSGGLGALVLTLGRRLSDRDRDGHGTLFGGKDCDDADPAVHPGARDIPDNNVDEDCSGADLRLDQLRAAARNVENGNVPRDFLERPDLPKDVSLLLITIDAWRADTAGFMGYTRPVTPFIDTLAARGTVYERAYSLASFTGHSIPAMMTGKWTSELIRNAAHEIRVSKDETFAAELVCASGVRCGAFLPHFLFKPSGGWNQGFSDWEVVHGEPADEQNVHNRTSAAELTVKARNWLRAPSNTGGRFFLWVHYFEPHREYLEHPGVPKFGDDRRAMYDHEVLFTDGHVKTLIEELESIGASERTVVLLTGDHGEGFLEHGAYAHGKELWEELLRVPMVVVGPGIATKRIDTPTSHIDIFPTILDLFGIALPEGTHGRSLLPEWRPGQRLDARPIVADQPRTPYFEMRRSYAEGRFKLIDSPQTGTRHLYHWTGEPEKDPIDKEQPQEYARMIAAYELFVAQQMKVIDPIE